MLTVACVLSKGPKRSYDATHVERLQKMVAEHVEQPYRFLCLTNEEVPCESLPLIRNWPGWWSKIELFCPGLFRGERDRVLYLDLDVTVTGNLDDLANEPEPFIICRDFQRLGLGLNSSVMAWDAGYADIIYTLFTEDVMERLNGDQNWIREVLPNATVFPRSWCISYKKSLGYKRPADMRVLIYHGDPKPWDLDDDQT